MTHIDIEALKQLQQELTQYSPAEQILWRSLSATHIGRVRQSNEDAKLESSEQGLWAVADGMGGHSRGDFASRTVIDALSQFKRLPTLDASIAEIERSLIEANSTCLNAFDGKRIGTTIALLFAFAQTNFFVWAGDSRVYRLRADKLEQLTEDHSLAQEKLRRGELSLEEAKKHPSAHLLTRAVGAHQSLKLELRHSDAKRGDRYLICSDGLYSEMTEAKLLEILTIQDRKAALDKLIDVALDHGGKDNITAILVDAE